MVSCPTATDLKPNRYQTIPIRLIMSSPPPTARMSHISYLTNTISNNTAKVDSYLQLHSLPQPSFAVDAPTRLLPSNANAPDIEEARTKAIEASIELQQLLQGPRSLLTPSVRKAVILISSPIFILPCSKEHSRPEGPQDAN